MPIYLIAVLSVVSIIMLGYVYIIYLDLKATHKRLFATSPRKETSKQQYKDHTTVLLFTNTQLILSAVYVKLGVLTGTLIACYGIFRVFGNMQLTTITDATILRFESVIAVMFSLMIILTFRIMTWKRFSYQPSTQQ